MISGPSTFDLITGILKRLVLDHFRIRERPTLVRVSMDQTSRKGLKFMVLDQAFGSSKTSRFRILSQECFFDFGFVSVQIEKSRLNRYLMKMHGKSFPIRMRAIFGDFNRDTLDTTVISGHFPVNSSSKWGSKFLPW